HTPPSSAPATIVPPVLFRWPVQPSAAAATLAASRESRVGAPARACVTWFISAAACTQPRHVRGPIRRGGGWQETWRRKPPRSLLTAYRPPNAHPPLTAQPPAEAAAE